MSKGLINEEHYVKNISIIWGNSMKMIDFEHKFDILVSSPPYGDNRTTVTYGQHSYLELQWIDQNDLPAEVDFDFLKTTQEIDSQSLGGKLNTKYIKEIFDEMLGRIPSLKSFFSKIPNTEYYKYYKTIAFINDFEKSLDNIILSMSKNAYYVWTIGNRRVAKREIPNDLILIDLMENRNIKLFYTAERRIINKKQPNKNNFSKTMDKEHILIFHNSL